jgi:tetratricopeptide (TPR) repeat protein
MHIKNNFIVGALAIAVLAGLGVVALQKGTSIQELAVSNLLQAQNAPETRSIDELFTAAEQNFKEGHYQKTIDVYLAVLIKEPTNVRATHEIAHTYRYWGKFDESEIWFLKAIALSPTDASLYTDFGKLYRNMNEPEKAEAVFKKSISLDPNYDLTYSYGLGYLYFDQKRYEESEKMFLKSLEINPNSEIGHSGLADLYREMGRYAESEAMYKKVFAINPNSESYLGLGWLYIYQAKYEEALVPLQAFLTNIREKGEVYYTMGQAYSKLGRADEAKRSFARAVELVPDNPLFKDALNSIDNVN